MDDAKLAQIDALKHEALEHLSKIREAVIGGNLKLRPEIENAILTDSAVEIERTPEQQLNDILKSRGISRSDRRSLIARTRKGVSRQIPDHTRRANEAARKQAAKRAVAKKASVTE